MEPIYSGAGPMRVAVLFSGGASAARSMLDDPNHGKLYTLVGGATHNPDADGIERLKPHIDVATYPTQAEFFGRNGLDPKKQSSKYAYWEYVADILRAFAPDVIALSGLFQIVRYPLISEKDNTGHQRDGEYANRIFNVHPADLTILTDGDEIIYAGNMDVSHVKAIGHGEKVERKFKGDNAVHDALGAGEKQTQSTIHIAMKDVDEGPIVVRSPYINTTGVNPEDYAKLQDFMKAHCDGPAFRKAMEIVSSGQLGINGSSLFLNQSGTWKELPYGGYSMGGIIIPSF